MAISTPGSRRISSRSGRGDYVALLAYIERDGAHIEALQKMRMAVRDRKHLATCAEFGPRFLHSTGQAYKGGPDSGVFLQITADETKDLKVPGQKASFGVIKAAQARGDFDVLTERGRRALRVHLKGDLACGPEGARCGDLGRAELGQSRMQLGMIGLGRMGGNIVRRLMQRGHSTVVYDKDQKAVAALAAEGAVGAATLEEFVQKLKPPRTAWVMLPAGAITEATDRYAGRPDAEGRRHHRWRQFVLAGRRPPRQGAARQGAALSRRRHLRRRLGAGARLLHDDRRRQGRRRPARSDLRSACAGHRRHPAHAASRRPRPARRAGLHPCRPGRRRSLRQDDPQRHRIRADAGLCRRLRHPEERQYRGAAGRASLRFRHRRHRRSVAARQRDPVLAARPHRRPRSPRTRRSTITPAMSRIPARAAGPSMRRSTRPCRPKC